MDETRTTSTAIAVHRCRFVDFAPSAISALAFPPLSLPSAKSRKNFTTSQKIIRFGSLAIGHANGNIDLCEWTGSEHQYHSPLAWVVRKTLPGPFPSKVDSLAFALRYPDNLGPDDVPSLPDLRLFSSGGGSDLVEWDIQRGCVRRTMGSQGGSIWSIAVNPVSTSIALGCEDGSIRLVSLLDDALTLQRRFDRVKCRLLSIAWGPPVPRKTACHTNQDGEGSSDDDNDRQGDWTDSWIVAGGSDSSLRKWDATTGRVLERMVTDKARGERTLVWAVGVLGDGTIVSGDSLGMVKFWDSRTCTQIQSFQGHNADVLCLTISPDGMAIYTSGVDQRISQFSLIRSGSGEDGQSAPHHFPTRWVHSCTRRMHSHDVRALAIWPPYMALPSSHRKIVPADVSPVLASGGLDMSVVLTPAAPPNSTVVKVTNPLCTSTDSTFEVSYHRRMTYTCGPSSTSAVQLARQARLLTCMRDTGITIWRIHRKQPVLDTSDSFVQDSAEIQEAGWEKALDMELNVHTSLLATAISDDGRWLVTSDLYEIKLFRLTKTNDVEIKPRRIRTFSSILQSYLPSLASTGGSAFCFTPDSSKLIIATTLSAYLLIVELGDDEDHDPAVLRTFDHHRSQNGVGNRITKMGRLYNTDESSDVNNISTSVNILRLAVSVDGQWLASSDDHGRTHIFSLDSVQHHCTLPSFPRPAHVLTFDPLHPSLLVMSFADDMLQIFDVESRQFPSWSQPLSDLLPKRLTHAHDPILGITFDPSTAKDDLSQALVWSSSWMCNVRLDDSSCANRSTRKRRRGNRKLSTADSSITLPSPIPNDDTEAITTGQPQELKIITRYRPNLYVDFIGPGELVVVERPLVDILATLPPAYFKHKYGSS